MKSWPSRANSSREAPPPNVNVVFPIDRLHELASEGVIGSVADYHYSLMGAGWPPRAIETTMRELAGRLLEDGVDAVCLAPV